MSKLTRNQASGAYRLWEPPQFGAPARLETVRETRNTEPDEARVPEPPEPATPAIKLPTADEIEQIYEEAHKSGYAAGYEESTARGRVEAMKLHGLVENFDKALQGFDGEVAEQLLDLAVELARQLVRRELREVPASVIDVVREALLQLPHGHAMVHLHRDDMELVREYLGEHIAHVGHRLVEDATVSRGGCRIEAAGSQIDATVETRWRRIMANLGREDEYDPALHLADEPDEDDAQEPGDRD